MFRLTLLSAAILGSCFINQARAQLTVPVFIEPPTKLEAFETNTSVVVLKATTDFGSISGEGGSVDVMCREMTDTSTGRKEQGIAIVIAPGDQPKSTMLIDYDEIARLLAAMRYLSDLRVTVTPLNAVDASYTTKGGFRVAALGNRRTGAVQFGARDARQHSASVLFSGVEMSKLFDLIEQAKATLDSVR